MKKKNKYLAIILALSLALISGTTVFAEAIITVIHVDNQVGNSGDVVTIPIRLKGGDDIGGFDIALNYNPQTLEFQDIEITAMIATGGMHIYHHEVEYHIVRLIFVTADTIVADGVVAYLTFLIIQDCPDGLPIGISEGAVIGGDDDNEFTDSEVSGVDEEFQNSLPDANVVVVGTDESVFAGGGGGFFVAAGNEQGTTADYNDDSPATSGNNDTNAVADEDTTTDMDDDITASEEDTDETRESEQDLEELPNRDTETEDEDNNELGINDVAQESEANSIDIDESPADESGSLRNVGIVVTLVIVVAGLLLVGILLWRKKRIGKEAMAIHIEPGIALVKSEGEETEYQEADIENEENEDESEDI